MTREDIIECVEFINDFKIDVSPDAIRQYRKDQMILEREISRLLTEFRASHNNSPLDSIGILGQTIGGEIFITTRWSA